MLNAFAALLPVFMLIMTGFGLSRTLMRDPAHWHGFEQLTYYVLFPALLIDTLARVDLASLPVFEVGITQFSSIIVMSLFCLTLRPWFAAKLKVGGPAFTSVFQGATRWNTFVALAIAGNLFGAHGIALASVAIVAMIPALNVICVWVLSQYASSKPPNWRDIGRALLRNPLIWSCAIGLALKLLHVPIPQPIHTFADTLGRSSLAVGLLIVGAGLQVGQLIRPRAETLITIALKLAVMPTLAIGIGHALGLAGIDLAVVACCSAAPAAATAYVLARQMGGDAPLLAQILTLQTLLANITMPIAITIANH